MTAPLDGTILPGVTRASILELTRSWGEFDVSERPIAIREVRQVWPGDSIAAREWHGSPALHIEMRCNVIVFLGCLQAVR